MSEPKPVEPICPYCWREMLDDPFFLPGEGPTPKACRTEGCVLFDLPLNAEKLKARTFQIEYSVRIPDFDPDNPNGYLIISPCSKESAQYDADMCSGEVLIRLVGEWEDDRG